MAIAASTARCARAMPDRGFHRLRIRRVVRETAEASSFVLEVPAELRDAYRYEPGQFLTFRTTIGGEAHARCYSMSSSPPVDAELKVTVKRVPGGLVSNWMLDTLASGDEIEASLPAGTFLLPPGASDVVAFAAGSGITPVISIVKGALATTARRVRLLYANRDGDAVIFGDELEALAERHPDRFEVVHHFDVERGFVDREALGPFVGHPPDAEHYICGPAPFMDVVERTLVDHGVPAARIHVERFAPTVRPAAPAAPGGPARVTIELDGRTATGDHRFGTTILQVARQLGMAPPFSCESGSCATCMARVVEGEVAMHVNSALTDEEVADGWILTCQSVPTTATVRVVYGYEEG